MKSLILAVVLLFPALASAHTIAEWNRNVETDMLEYHVYVCKTKGCTITQSASFRAGVVPQPLPGSIPTYTLPRDVEGAIAISAVDTTGNESGLSVTVPFDTKGPGVPSAPVLK